MHRVGLSLVSDRYGVLLLDHFHLFTDDIYPKDVFFKKENAQNFSDKHLGGFQRIVWLSLPPNMNKKNRYLGDKKVG